MSIKSICSIHIFHEPIVQDSRMRVVLAGEGGANSIFSYYIGLFPASTVCLFTAENSRHIRLHSPYDLLPHKQYLSY